LQRKLVYERPFFIKLNSPSLAYFEIFWIFLVKLLARFHLRRQVKNAEVREKLKPKYEFGCKRVTPSSEYYPAFNRPNVELITSRILNVTGDSIRTDDGKVNQIEVDFILIF